MRDNIILEDELQISKRPASSRLSDPGKPVPRPDNVQYEIMSLNTSKQNGVIPPGENADVSLSEDFPHYVNVSDGASQSGMHFSVSLTTWLIKFIAWIRRS